MTVGRRSFHTQAAATPKARSPAVFRLVQGTTRPKSTIQHENCNPQHHELQLVAVETKAHFNPTLLLTLISLFVLM